MAANPSGSKQNPGSRELISALKECGRSKDVPRGVQLHAHAAETGLLRSNPFVANSLITMYSKCGRMADAKAVFDTMNHLRDRVSWNSLLQGYVENGYNELAIQFFNAMGNLADGRSFVSALSACIALAGKDTDKEGKSTKWLDEGRRIHALAAESKCCDIYVENRLIDMYFRGGSAASAREVFDGMIRRDLVSWTALLKGYVENGESLVALEIFKAMQRSSVPDARAYVVALSACANLASKTRLENSKPPLNQARLLHSQAVVSKCRNMYVENALVDLYGKCGSMPDARRVFDSMVRRDVVSWTSLMLGYVDNGENEVALEIVSEMNVALNPTTYVAVLMACGNLMAAEKGREVHAEIRSRGFEQDVKVANSLIDFYGKCGCLEAAKQVFDTTKRKSTVSWNSLMCGYGLQGDTGKVFEIFSGMRERGFSPDHVTFVCLLTACSHGGLTEKGKEIFNVMHAGYGVAPALKHYVCVIDMLGRANLVEEAMRVLRNMPFEAEVVTWTAVLCACHKWGDVEVGKVAYEALMGLDRGREASAYVMMSSIYKGAGVRKGEAGAASLSLWTDERGKVYRFT